MTKTVEAAVAAYVDATNSHDPAAFGAAFWEDAVVDDVGREISGRPAILAWAEREIFHVNVTLEVLDITERGDGATLTVKVDGTFDRTGLPDPLIMTHAVDMSDGKIRRLTCRLGSSAAPDEKA